MWFLHTYPYNISSYPALFICLQFMGGYIVEWPQLFAWVGVCLLLLCMGIQHFLILLRLYQLALFLCLTVVVTQLQFVPWNF